MDVSLSLPSLKAGGKPGLARALALIEERPDEEAVVQLLSEAYRHPLGQTVGVTGPPGVGKSSLISGLIRHWRGQQKSIGCIAVDPSSRRTGGALLGDRTRFDVDPEDQGVFIRSMAARERLGGLASLSVSAMVVMRALYDIVLVETVGVGQSEVDIADVADTVVLCVQPGAGDSLQFMKAGIAEVPHLVVVTKADMGAAAERARLDVEAALKAAPAGSADWSVPVLLVSSRDADSLACLARAVADHFAHLGDAGQLAQTRDRQAACWLEDAVRERFGRDGIVRAGDLTLSAGESPFHRLARTVERLTVR